MEEETEGKHQYISCGQWFEEHEMIGEVCAFGVTFWPHVYLSSTRIPPVPQRRGEWPAGWV